jgi:hypothetical protein
MIAKLKATGDEHAPYKLLLKGQTATEKKVLQSWLDRNPLGESVGTGLGWLRLKVIGADPPKELIDDYLPELTKPQRIEALQIRAELQSRRAKKLDHDQRFERAVMTAKPRISDWIDQYKEERKLRRARKKKRSSKK